MTITEDDLLYEGDRNPEVRRAPVSQNSRPEAGFYLEVLRDLHIQTMREGANPGIQPKLGERTDNVLSYFGVDQSIPFELPDPSTQNTPLLSDVFADYEPNGARKFNLQADLLLAPMGLTYDGLIDLLTNEFGLTGVEMNYAWDLPALKTTAEVDASPQHYTGNPMVGGAYAPNEGQWPLTGRGDVTWGEDTNNPMGYFFGTIAGVTANMLPNSQNEYMLEAVGGLGIKWLGQGSKALARRMGINFNGLPQPKMPKPKAATPQPRRQYTPEEWAEAWGAGNTSDNIVIGPWQEKVPDQGFDELHDLPPIDFGDDIEKVRGLPGPIEPSGRKPFDWATDAADDFPAAGGAKSGPERFGLGEGETWEEYLYTPISTRSAVVGKFDVTITPTNIGGTAPSLNLSPKGDIKMSWVVARQPEGASELTIGEVRESLRLVGELAESIRNEGFNIWANPATPTHDRLYQRFGMQPIDPQAPAGSGRPLVLPGRHGDQKPFDWAMDAADDFPDDLPSGTPAEEGWPAAGGPRSVEQDPGWLSDFHPDYDDSWMTLADVAEIREVPPLGVTDEMLTDAVDKGMMNQQNADALRAELRERERIILEEFEADGWDLGSVFAGEGLPDTPSRVPHSGGFFDRDEVLSEFGDYPAAWDNAVGPEERAMLLEGHPDAAGIIKRQQLADANLPFKPWRHEPDPSDYTSQTQWDIARQEWQEDMWPEGLSDEATWEDPALAGSEPSDPPGVEGPPGTLAGYEEFADDPLFREFVELSDKTQLAEKSSILEPFTTEQEALFHAEPFDWEAFSRSRGYSEEEITDFRRWLEVEKELSAKYPDDPDFTFGIVYQVSIDSPSYNRRRRSRQQESLERLQDFRAQLEGRPGTSTKDLNELKHGDLNVIPESMLPDNVGLNPNGQIGYFGIDDSGRTTWDEGGPWWPDGDDEEILDFLGITHIDGVPRATPPDLLDNLRARLEGPDETGLGSFEDWPGWRTNTRDFPGGHWPWRQPPDEWRFPPGPLGLAVVLSPEVINWANRTNSSEHIDFMERNLALTAQGITRANRSTGSEPIDGLDGGFRGQAHGLATEVGAGVVPIIGREDPDLLKGVSRDLRAQGINPSAVFANEVRREMESGNAMIVGYKSQEDYELAMNRASRYGVIVDGPYWRRPTRKSVRPGKGTEWTRDHLKQLATAEHFYPDAGLRQGPR